MSLTPGANSQLYVIDPIARLNPAKDTSVALMQAAQRAGQQVWVCTLADLSAAERPTAPLDGHGAWVRAQPVTLAPMDHGPEGWREIGRAHV